MRRRGPRAYPDPFALPAGRDERERGEHGQRARVARGHAAVGHAADRLRQQQRRLCVQLCARVQPEPCRPPRPRFQHALAARAADLCRRRAGARGRRARRARQPRARAWRRGAAAAAGRCGRQVRQRMRFRAGARMSGHCERCHTTFAPTARITQCIPLRLPVALPQARLPGACPARACGAL